MPIPSTNLVNFAAGSTTVASAMGRMLTTSSLTSSTGTLLAPPVVQIGFTGTGGYPVSTPARLERIGYGCGGTFQSFYQDFQVSEGFDLANKSLTLTPNSVVAPTSYVVTAGTTPPDLTKLGGAPLSTAESAMVPHALGFTFPYVSGSTTSIGACSEGYVWLDPAMTLIDSTPAVLELIGSSVAQTARVAPFWHNFHLGRNVTTHPNAGLHVITDTSGGPGNAVCYITWHKVGLSITTVAGASVCDMQCVLRQATGVVEFRYGNMAIGPATLGITGFSPGRIGTVPSFHPGPRNLSHEVPFATGPDSGVTALSHGTLNQARPAIGTSITFQSYNQPVGTAIGLHCLDAAALEPSVHVPGLMAPGCGITMSPTFLIAELAVAPTGTWSATPLAIQPAWLGLAFFSQYFAADANLVLSSSNGLKLTVGLP